MPEESGLQLAEKVHNEFPNCKLLLLTAYDTNVIKVEQHATRTKRPLKLLSKPCRPEVLLREAHDLLQTA
jgi:CheY-like chemotaxis protein